MRKTPFHRAGGGEAKTEEQKSSASRFPRLVRGLAWVGAAGFVYAVSTWFSLQFFVRSAETLSAPDLRGMKIEEAQAGGIEMGLNVVESHREANDGLEEGFILDQNPEPGFALRRGQNVFVTVSMGSPEIGMPPLTGKVLAEAQETLHRQQLALGDVARVHSAAVLENVVLAQEPPADSSVFPGTAVHLIVSAGPAAEWLWMPHFTGFPASSASTTLRDLGLKAQLIEKDAPSAQEKGMVLAQYPMGGTRFRKGDAISLTVGR
jgi:serine/threonine-protein kinase